MLIGCGGFETDDCNTAWETPIEGNCCKLTILFDIQNKTNDSCGQSLLTKKMGQIESKNRV